MGDAAAEPYLEGRLQYEFGVFDAVVKELETHVLPESAPVDEKIKHFRAAIDSLENIIIGQNLSMECTSAVDCYLSIWADDLNKQVESPSQKKALQIAKTRQDLIYYGREMMESADFSNDAVSDDYAERVHFHGKGGVEAFNAVKKANPQIPSPIASLLTYGVYMQCMKYAEASLHRTFKQRALFRKRDVQIQQSDAQAVGGIHLDSKEYPYAWVRITPPKQGTLYQEFASEPEVQNACHEIAQQRAKKIFSKIQSLDDDSFIADILELQRDAAMLSKRGAPTLSRGLH